MGGAGSLLTPSHRETPLANLCAKSVPSDLDIYRSAKLLINQCGEDAPIFAAMQADKCFEAGDLDGKAVWMRVIRAIGELQDRRPPAVGQPVH